MAEQAEPEYLFPLDELRAQIYLVLGQSEQAQKAVQQAHSYYEQKIQLLLWMIMPMRTLPSF